MSKKQKKQNSNNSMFLYTALIFVVALILIIIAFFGQKNIIELRRTTDAMNSSNQESLQNEVQNDVNETPTADPKTDELAIMANTLSNLQAENSDLKNSIDVYDKLLAANGYLSAGNTEEAKNSISTIDASKLTSDQLILYNQILTTIDEGKEQ